MKHPWFPLYVADYLAKTGHLSQAQHGVYLLLMMHYYATRKPIPDDRKSLQLVTKAFPDDQLADVDIVLGSFFRHESDGWHHDRIDQELCKLRSMEEASQKRNRSRSEALPPERRKAIARAAAEARWKGSTQTKDLGNAHASQHASADASPHASRMLPDASQSQSQSQSEVKTTAKALRAVVFPDWLPKEAWDHYEQMRRQIRKPMTDQARIWAIERLDELRGLGNDPKAVLQQSVLNSWSGLFELKKPPSGLEHISKLAALGRQEYDTSGNKELIARIKGGKW